MKSKIRIVMGILLLIGGVCLGIFSEGGNFSSRIWTFVPCFTGGMLLGIGILQQKRASEPYTDEMHVKAGYTSLALSCQLLLFIDMLILSVDSFFPFLQDYSAKWMAAVILMLGGILILLSSRYYSHHPDKTGL